jgi:hypothetical protein
MSAIVELWHSLRSDVYSQGKIPVLYPGFFRHQDHSTVVAMRWVK